jgi:hypothetical protein
VKYRESNDISLKVYYRRYGKILTSVIKLAKRMYYEGKILKSKNKIKTAWEIIKKENGKNYNMNEIHSIQNKDTVINEPRQIADTFNNYFISIANTICATVTNDKNETSTNKTYLKYLNNIFKKPFSKIKWNYVTTYEVIKIIKSLKEKKACGYDEVPIKITKLSAPYIISPITYICNQLLISGVFPDIEVFHHKTHL